jgi:hypothetical protein
MISYITSLSGDSIISEFKSRIGTVSEPQHLQLSIDLNYGQAQKTLDINEAC